MGPGAIDNVVLERIESEHPSGFTSVALLDTLASLGIKFTEATLRKWVQLGLLPRSIRVGGKGKHLGSRGIYPVSTVRQIVQIKEMLAGDLTVEQIQREVLFVRGDLEELERSLTKIFQALKGSIDKVDSQTVRYSLSQEVGSTKEQAHLLINRLRDIETRLIGRVALGSNRAATG